jgi:hypothetical protein
MSLRTLELAITGNLRLYTDQTVRQGTNEDDLSRNRVATVLVRQDCVPFVYEMDNVARNYDVSLHLLTCAPYSPSTIQSPKINK